VRRDGLNGIAVDATSVYWAAAGLSANTGAIMKVAKWQGVITPIRGSAAASVADPS
jgi:hypothetical protein